MAQQAFNLYELEQPQLMASDSCSSRKSVNMYQTQEFSGNYTAHVFVPSHRRPITFPKSVLTTNVPEIREFDDPSKHLYYFLNWSSKMVMLDRGFIHFQLCNSRHIGVFNTELHDKRTNAVLYVVANLSMSNSTNSKKECQPVWIMDQLLTARQIAKTFGIKQCDLPNGSRALHNCFESEINAHYARLTHLVNVPNWNKIPKLIGAQKTLKREESRKNKKKSFINLDCLNHIDLNAAIRCSIEQIQREELELIPILNINNRVYCDALIPIKVGKNAWFAVQYKMATISPFRATVTGLCVDAEDILNKASLVDPNAVSAYKWILGRQLPSPLSLEDSDSIRSDTSMVSDLTSSNTFGLAKQLQDALQREKMLTVMLMTQTQLKSSTSVRVANSVPPPSQPVDMSCISNSVMLGTSMMRISSHSAPMLPMVSPNGLITPPPFMLNGATTQSAHTSPSFGAQQAGMQNLFDFSLNP